MEKLGRSVIAMAQTDNTVYIGWRLLGTDPEDLAFNLYRSTNGANPTLLALNVTATCDYVDTTADLTVPNAYFVRPVRNGVEQAASTAFTLKANPSRNPYISIPYQPRAGDPPHSNVEVYPGDIDGDGEYEYIVRWSRSSYIDAGEPQAATDTYKVEAYRLDGTKYPWRVDLGWNVMTGLEISPAAVHDLDGDGKVEFICMSAEASTDGLGATIGDTDGDGITDYRNADGIPYSGPRFLCVYSGETGELLARAPWPVRKGILSDYGRNHICIAYLDGKTPSIVVEAAHDQIQMEAWNYSNRQLTNVWTWEAGANTAWRKKASHMTHVADVNGDGKDDVLVGSLTMGPDGNVIYSKTGYGEGHGDYFYVGDMDPDRPGLEVSIGYETAGPRGFQVYDAATGGHLWSVPTDNDTGTTGSGPFRSDLKGYQVWGAAGAFKGFYDIKGNYLAAGGPDTSNVWWDADLCREISNNGTIYKYDHTWLVDRPYDHNGWGDFLGDWREEELNSNGSELRIYTTAIPATNRMYTLMHDPQYRLGVSMVNQRKLPAILPSFYIGPQMATPPPAPVSDAQLIWRGNGTNNTWNTNSTPNWVANPYWSSNSASCNFTAGATVLFDLSGVNTVPVLLSGSVSPGMVKVHCGTDYVFGGTGSLSGTTKLIKAGRGTLTMTNVNSYTGSTLVAEGTLRVNGKLTASPMTVRGGGAWGPSQVSGTGTVGGVIMTAGGGVAPGDGVTAAGTLKVNNYFSMRGGTISNFDLSDDPTGVSKKNDQVQVTGNVFLSGTAPNSIVINRLNGSLAPGTYKLITYTGTLSGGAANLSVSGMEGIPYTLSITPGQIALVVRATRAFTGLTWTGAGSSTWDLATTTSWSNGGTPDWFVAGDSVRFDDSGAANATVNLSEIAPIGGMVVDSTAHYTIGGGGYISGAGGILKTGSGTLSLLTDNTYTGSTSIRGGVLEVDRLNDGGRPSPIGAASSDPSNLLLADGGTVRVVGLTAASTDRGVTLEGGWGAVDVPNAGSAVCIMGNLVGAGGLLKTGLGTLYVRTDVNGQAANTYTGGTMISGGTLHVSRNNNLGALDTPVYLANGAILEFAWGQDFDRPLVLLSGGGTFSALYGDTFNQISGVGRLTLDNGFSDPIFYLSGSNNTYSGGTTINDRVQVYLTSPTAMGTGEVRVNAGGQLRFRPGATSLQNNLAIAGNALALHGESPTLSGTITLIDNATISSSNSSGLSITVNGPVVLGSKTLSMKPGIITTTATAKWFINGVISGTGDLLWNTVNSGSSLTLGGANTFTGDTIIENVAALTVANPLALQNSNLIYNNGALKFASGTTACTLGSLSGSRNLSLANLTTNAAVALRVGNNDASTLYSGVISNTGSLTKIGTGTLTLTGASTYTGSTTISSGTLVLSGVLSNTSSFSLGNGATLVLAGGTVTANSLTVAAGSTVQADGTLNGAVTNNGTIVVTGTLTINGSLTNNGTIEVPFGTTLVVNGPVTNNGTVDARGGGTITTNSTWSGNAAQVPPPPATYTTASAGNWTTGVWSPGLPVAGIGTRVLFNNGVTISSVHNLGSLRLNQLKFSSRSVNLSGDPLQFDGATPSLVSLLNYPHSVTNLLTLTQDTDFAITSNVTTVSGVVGGPGALLKSGSGTLTLSATNTYTGGTVISGGTLSITKESNLGVADGDLSFANGGILQIATGNVSLDNNHLILQAGGGVISHSTALTINGLISGPGSLTKSGTGVLTLDGLSNTYSGGTLVQGEISDSTSGALGTGLITVASGGQITLRPGLTRIDNDLNLAGTGVSASGALYNSGAGAVALNGAVTLSGNATISATNTNNNNFTFNGPVNLGANTFRLKMGANAGTTSQKWTFLDSIAGTGGISLVNSAVSGTPFNTLELAAANTFSGITLMSIPPFGTLKLNVAHVNALMNSTLDTGALGSQSVAFTVTGANTYNLGGLKGADNLAIGANTIKVGANGTSTAYTGIISGTGNLTKVGTGALTLSGANTYTGITTVTGGILYHNGASMSPTTTVAAAGTLRGSGSISGDLQVQGSLSPGNAAGATTLTANSASILAGGALGVQLNGSNGTATALQLSGNLSLNSSAQLNAVYTGTAPAAGTRFVIVTYGGTWNGVPFAGMADDNQVTISGYSFLINYNDGGAVTLTATPAMLTNAQPATFENWASTYQLAGSKAEKNADPDQDGDGNLLEFATGSRPDQASSKAKLFSKIQPIGGVDVFTATIAVRSGAAFAAQNARQQVARVDGLTYIVEASSDLVLWDQVAVEELSPALSLEVQGALADQLPVLDKGWSWHSFRLQESASQGYLRLRVVQP